MEALDHWLLADEFSVIEAALLIVEVDPAAYEGRIESLRPEERPQGFYATKSALSNAILAGRLRATIRHSAWDRGYAEEPGEDEELGRNGRRQFIYKSDPDWHKTTVTRDDLVAWLTTRNLKPSFFFPAASNVPDYLDPNHPNYPRKLAVGVHGWQAVNANPELIQGMSVKKGIKNWVRLHAKLYGLTKDDGSPNEQAIEQVAKVANWVFKGGAPRTPNQSGTRHSKRP